MLFEIDKELIDIISSLHGDPRWEMFKQRLKSMSESMGNELLHSIPNESDHNYQSRLDVQRGIVVCLDILQNTMYNFLEIGDDIKQQEINQQRMKDIAKAL